MRAPTEGLANVVAVRRGTSGAVCSEPDFERLSLLTDGDLPPGEARALRRHLHDCPVCTESARFMESLPARLRRLRAPPLSAATFERVMRGAAERLAATRAAP